LEVERKQDLSAPQPLLHHAFLDSPPTDAAQSLGQLIARSGAKLPLYDAVTRQISSSFRKQSS
jgi:hypothetical protein